MQSVRRQQQFRSLCNAIRTTNRPILIGPWRGEVGFEVLYWLPWLTKLRTELQIAPERLFPITRGGAGSWYGTPQALELYALRTPQQVRVENRRQHAQTRMLKQTHVTEWDREVLRDATAQLGVQDPIVLHPEWMYAQLTPFWEQVIGLTRLLDHTTFQIPLPTVVPPESLTLPPQFVAVKFYARATFPYDGATKGFVAATVRHLASQQPVILLNADIHVDDHLDFPVTGPNIIHLRDLVATTPENNLAVQSAILAKAQGFVGTYGGFSQLALMLGKPSVSFYTKWEGTCVAHKHLADDLALRAGVATVVTQVAHLPLLDAVYPVSRVANPVAPALQSA